MTRTYVKGHYRTTTHQEVSDRRDTFKTHVKKDVNAIGRGTKKGVNKVGRWGQRTRRKVNKEIT